MPTTTLPKKLQLKAEQHALILHAPPGYLDTLAPLPPGVKVVQSGDGQYDFVQLFIKNLADLQATLPAAVQAVKPDGLFWIAYPKGGAKAGTDVNRDILWEAVSQHNLTGVSLIALDETWSCMRFRAADKVASKRQ
ncbi:hypothetical protein [Dictyobacter formicarum]|uniref:DUF3052 domain-containing protein n=1 Tax=Dictyobacter formicarum TaxID=2778368 RepID=A0ABQ3VU87_9CHLR|nr:hypothetical protein [Dictyobacter formicarum]GHO89254.1 hypothetical protein KSZ_72600 [Dictyobacter formicarum]